MAPISVLLASPHTPFRARLRAALAGDPELEVRGEAATPNDLLDAGAVEKPDVVLLDVDLDANEATPVLTRLQARLPAARTLLVGDSVNERLTLVAVDQGAAGCLPRTASCEDWRRAVRAAASGELWLNRQLLVQAIEALIHQRSPAGRRRDGGLGPRRAVLTDRQREIVRCTMQGLSNKHIARKLGISPTTVKTHLRHIFSKLGISGRLLLVAQPPRDPGEPTRH